MSGRARDRERVPARHGARDPERILVRGPNWLGDVVMATPGLRLLRRACPAAEIVLELPAPLHPLLAGSGLCDALWSVQPHARSVAALGRDARRIARHGFDLGLAIPESISSALRMRLGGVRRVVGFARDPLRRALLHEVVPAPAAWGPRRLVSRERFVLQLVESVTGLHEADRRISLEVTPEEQQRLEEVLAARGLAPGALAREAPVVIAPGAGFGESKCWPVESFAALADRLLARGRRVVLLGGPGEGTRLQAVVASMAGPSRAGALLVLDAALDLGAVKALLSRAAALVANDAGLRHVAAAFGRPSVVFFGPTAIEKTADNLDAIEALETEHGCRPCYRRHCPIDHRCLRSIGVAEAEAALDRVERRGGAPGAGGSGPA